MLPYDQFTSLLKTGKVYRVAALMRFTKSAPRYLETMREQGKVEKVGPGLYYVPRQTTFGPVPAEPKDLVKAFLKTDDFLLVSPNAYNGLGVGTTQLHNTTIVYNRKRHGKFSLGGQNFDFRCKTHVPKKLTKEVLLVDLLHNLPSLGEDTEQVLTLSMKKAASFDKMLLQKAVNDYGSERVKRKLANLLEQE